MAQISSRILDNIRESLSDIAGGKRRRAELSFKLEKERRERVGVADAFSRFQNILRPTTTATEDPVFEGTGTDRRLVRRTRFGRTTQPSRERIIGGLTDAVGELRRFGETGRTAADQFIRIGRLALERDRGFGSVAARVLSGEFPLETAVNVTRELAEAGGEGKAKPKLKLPTNADQLIILKHADPETGEIDFDAALPELEARQVRQKIATQKASKEEPENFFLFDSEGNVTGIAAGITGKQKFAARKSIQIRLDNAEENIIAIQSFTFVGTPEQKAELITKWQDRANDYQAMLDVLTKSSVQAPKVKAPNGKKPKFEVLSVE